MTSLDGKVIAQRYHIIDELGRGGMAVVYKAQDTRLDRLVALKLLHPFLATQSESAARFKREAEAIAKLHHPNIVEIYDTGQDEFTGSQYLVMELVQGPTLAEFIKAHPTKIPEIAVAMTCSMCDAIEHAHEAGIIHRDIKPENILIDKSGTMKLTDFGIARVLDKERMTTSGSLVGSPAHMPPEIIEGQSYGFSCDIFSLGTVFYYALTGALPFSGTTPMSIFKAILDGHYQPPGRRNMAISKKIDDVIARCLKTNPSDRYADADALKSDLVAILQTVKFDNYAQILEQYFADVDDFNAKAIPEITDTLNQLARVQTREKAIPKALETLNIILSYAPDDARALALLNELRQGNRARRVAAWCSIPVAVAAIAFCIYYIALAPSDADADGHGIIANHAIEAIDADKARAASHTAQTLQNTTNQGSPTDAAERRIENDDNRPFTVLAYAQLAATRDAKDARADAPIIHSDATNAEENAELGVDPELRSDDRENESQAIDSKTVAPKDVEAPRRRFDKPTTPKVPRQRANPIATPKKVNQGGAKRSTPESPDDSQTAIASATPLGDMTPTNHTAQPPPTDAVAKSVIIQPVFPPDAYAVVKGQRFDANSDGDIRLELAPGNYSMTLTCRQRCIKQTHALKVTASADPVTREIVSLDWADAKLSLTGPDSKSVYFVAKRIDDHSNRVLHLAARTQNAIAGFNIFGKPITLEVYAIPKSHTLSSYDTDALEAAKYASTRVSIAPGETRSIQF